MEQEDNVWMRLVQEGDKAAFEKLVLKYREKAQLYSFSILKDEKTAEDVVQESFIDLYIHRLQYKFTYKFSTLLFTIVKHKSIDYLRKNNRRNEVSIDEEFPDSVLPEYMVLAEEERKQMIQLLSGMKKEYREVLYLFAVENLSYKEIAQKMNKTLAQVKIILYRARKKAIKIKEDWDR